VRLLQDLRYVIRLLFNNRWLTLTAGVVLAL
jgi:hypothetical protein